MAIGFIVPNERGYLPRNALGHYKAQRDVNEHPAHIGGEVADIQAEMLGVGRYTGETVTRYLQKNFPSQTPVGRGKIMSKSGRGQPAVDAAGDNGGLSFKVVALDSGSCEAGACVLTTPVEETARGFFAELAATGLDIPVLTLLAPRDESGFYVVDPACVRFDVSYPFREFAAGGLDAALARYRGRGRPAKGAPPLPNTWAKKVRTNKGANESIQLSFRHPRTDGDLSGWRTGTLAEVRALVARLIGKR